MSKNSFTENFNNCIKGFPVASIAARMVLNEGLIGDALKLGIAGLGAYGLYNGINGDQNIFGNTIKNAGETAGKFISGLGNGNDTFSNIGSKITSGMSSAGESLNNALDKGREWVQDLPVGKAFGLGGEVAAHRQHLADKSTQYMNVTRKAMDDEISTMQQREDLTPSQKMEQKSDIENKYRQNANTYAEDEWTKSHNGQPWRGTQTATAATQQQPSPPGRTIKKPSGMPSTPTAAPKPAAPSTPQVNKQQPVAKSSTTELTNT